MKNYLPIVFTPVHWAIPLRPLIFHITHSHIHGFYHLHSHKGQFKKPHLRNVDENQSAQRPRLNPGHRNCETLFHENSKKT